MRVIIVGLGGVGAMAAWQISAAGHSVVGLEQNRIDHDLGSSYGDSRIVRRVYHQPIYTRMMATAYELWARLMIESGEPDLFVQSGGIFFGPADHPDIQSAELALRESEVPFERLDASETMRRFPAFRMQENESALYEPSMGYARASNAVRAAIGLATRCGATIREGARVTSIERKSNSVRVTLQSGDRLDADSLLIAAGPWARTLLESIEVKLPVTVTRQPYVHLAPLRHPENFEPGRFPVWIDAGANSYGFPRLGDVGGVKVGIHDYGPASNPDTVERSLTEDDREAARAYAARRFPDLGRAAVYEKVCLYTVTPDTDFIVDSPPASPNIIIISACSGHGFKFTPLMGKIAADMIAEMPPCCDLSHFRLNRFSGND